MRSIDWCPKRQLRCFVPNGMLIAFAVAITFCVQNATIAMESCPAIDDSPKEKLAISRFRYSGLQDSAQKWDESEPFWAADALAVNLREVLKKVPFYPADCRRHLNLDASDFQPPIVTAMRNRHVLFEVWGELKTSVVNKQTEADGKVIYYMIPTPESPWLLPAHLKWDYHNGNVVMGKLFNDIFNRGHHFEVLAIVAYGIEESGNHEYDKASCLVPGCSGMG